MTTGGIGGELYTGTIGPINTAINAMNATGNLFSGFNFPSNALNAFFGLSGKLNGEHSFELNKDVTTSHGGDTFSAGVGEKKTGRFVLSKNYMITVKRPGEVGELIGWLTEYQISQLRKRHQQKAAYRFGGKMEIEVEVTRAASDQGLWHVHKLWANPVGDVTNPWFANTAMTLSARLDNEEAVGVVDILCSIRQTGNIPCVASEAQISRLTVWGDGRVSDGQGPLFAGLGSQLQSAKPPQPAGAAAYLEVLRRQLDNTRYDTTTKVTADFDQNFALFVSEVARNVGIDPESSDRCRELEDLLRAGVQKNLVAIYHPASGMQYYENRERREKLVMSLGEDAESFVELLIRADQDDETIISRWQDKLRGGKPRTLTMTLDDDERDLRDRTTREVGNTPPNDTWSESAARYASAAADNVRTFVNSGMSFMAVARETTSAAVDQASQWWSGRDESHSHLEASSDDEETKDKGEGSSHRQINDTEVEITVGSDNGMGIERGEKKKRN